jgi:hypothetical protein
MRRFRLLPRLAVSALVVAVGTASCGDSDGEAVTFAPGEAPWACSASSRTITTTDRAAPNANVTLDEAILDAVGTSSNQTDRYVTADYTTLNVLNAKREVTASYRMTRWVNPDGSLGGWYSERKEVCSE